MSDLSEIEISALIEALDDEYHAWATYDKVIADFGELAPFSNVREAEARHIEALLTLFARYGLAVPANPWPGKVTCYASRQEACEAAVAAEIANGEMYTRLFEATRRPDILTVLRNLQEASQQRHLPAFQRCAQQTADDGSGFGGRRHRGGRGHS
jgi:hypothetical protein